MRNSPTCPKPFNTIVKASDMKYSIAAIYIRKWRLPVVRSPFIRTWRLPGSHETFGGFDGKTAIMSANGGGESGGAMAMTATAPTVFATRSERAVVLSILRDDFGEIAEKIASELLRSDGMRLVEVVTRVQAAALVVKPSVHEIKCTLLKLLQHNLLVVKPAMVHRGHSGGAAAVSYNVRSMCCNWVEVLMHEMELTWVVWLVNVL